jgi:hypothetical protein
MSLRIVLRIVEISLLNSIIQLVLIKFLFFLRKLNSKVLLSLELSCGYLTILWMVSVQTDNWTTWLILVRI